MYCDGLQAIDPFIEVFAFDVDIFNEITVSCAFNEEFTEEFSV